MPVVLHTRTVARWQEAVWYVCELFILKPVNNDGYDAIGDEIEIYVRIMDSVHY